MWRQWAAGEKRYEVTLECFAHDEVDDWILRAVRMSEQQRQRRQPRQPVGTGLHSAAVRWRHRAGRGEVQVEIDDVVRQPEGGEEAGDYQEHDGGSSSAGQHTTVAARRVAVAPQQCGVVAARQQGTAGSYVRRHDDHSRYNVDEDAERHIERLTGTSRRPVLVTEVQPFSATQPETVQWPHGGQRRHDGTCHHPGGTESRRYDDAGRREIAGFDGMTHSDVSVDA